MKRKLDVYTLQHYSVIEEIGPSKVHLFACVKDYHGTPFKAYHMASFKTFHMAMLYVKDVLEQTIELDYITIVDDSREGDK